MNEFQWLQQTRALARPVAPQQDLWSNIAARIDAPAQPPSRRGSRWLPLAMAASLGALSLLAGMLAWQQHGIRSATMQATPLATTPWKPTDPRLAGAAIELHSAQLELGHALRAHPDNTWLRDMLEFTRQKQHHLQQLEHPAS